MITLEDIRSAAMPLPEVAEGTHFRLPSFKVRDKVFFVLQQGDRHAIAHVSEADAKAAAAEEPGVCEAVWRNDGQIFVGARVDLTKVSEERFRTLVELAWRNKAPKRVVAAHDAGA